MSSLQGALLGVIHDGDVAYDAATCRYLIREQPVLPHEAEALRALVDSGRAYHVPASLGARVTPVRVPADHVAAAS